MPHRSHLPSTVFRALVVAGLTGLATAAHANCEGLADSASTVAPAEIGATYAQLVACDAKLATDRFDDFMRASKDVTTLTALSFAAIDNNVQGPVLAMLEKVPDMSTRDEVAKAVGAGCGEHPGVVSLLKAGHGSLGDRQFGMWREAFRACPSEDLDAWLVEVTVQPPGVAYDEKYNVVTESLVKRQGAASLAALQKAAVVAAKNGGPFSTILDRMNEAVRPATFGAKMSEEDRKKLEKALVAIAQKVGPENAKQVADRLYQAGAEEAAASLLPAIYPDRVKGKGLTYGVASIESCDNVAVVHYAEVSEPAKRWSIVDDVQEPALAFKPRLKCTPEGTWPVLTTPEPLAKGGLDAWVEQIESDWAGKGLSVKLREEKGIELE